MGRGKKDGGGDSLIKVGTDVRRVLNLGRAKFPLPPKKKNNDLASFHELQSAKIGHFRQEGHFFHSFIKYYTFFSLKLLKT